MADRSTRTTLALGSVNAPVALWKCTADKQTEIKFDTAGPNGGKLMARAGVKVEPMNQVDGPVDPLDPQPGKVVEQAQEAAARYTRVLVEEGTGEAVEPGEVRKGVRTEDGFIDLTEHLAAVDEMTKLEEMRIEGFVSVTAIERTIHRVQGAYWVGPADGSAYTLSLIRSAMLKQMTVAVVRWTKRSRQSLGLLVCDEAGLLLLDIAFAELVREPKRDVHLVHSLEVKDEHLEMASTLVAEMTYPPTLVDRIVDDAVELRALLAEVAREGITPEIPERVEPEEDLSDLLQRSLSA